MSVLADESGRFVLKDNEDTEVVPSTSSARVFCLRAGKRFDADARDPAQPILAAAA